MCVQSLVDVARELISWVSPAPRSLLVLTCYLDDSGTHATSDAIIFGGLVGEREQWEKFEQRWQAKLADPLPGKPPLRRFHMFDCEWGVGDFFGYSRGERDALIHDFRQIILDSGVSGVSSGISRKDWVELAGDLRDRLRPADEMAFAALMSNLQKLNQRGMTLVVDNTGAWREHTPLLLCVDVANSFHQRALG